MSKKRSTIVQRRLLIFISTPMMKVSFIFIVNLSRSREQTEENLRISTCFSMSCK